mgnify:CR=1 FL=1
MEGSAIARNSSKRSISNAKDPDMDGCSQEHPSAQGALKGNTQPQPSLGKDQFHDRDGSKGQKIKGGLYA